MDSANRQIADRNRWSQSQSVFGVDFLQFEIKLISFHRQIRDASRHLKMRMKDTVIDFDSRLMKLSFIYSPFKRDRQRRNSTKIKNNERCLHYSIVWCTLYHVKHRTNHFPLCFCSTLILAYIIYSAWTALYQCQCQCTTHAIELSEELNEKKYENLNPQQQ